MVATGHSITSEGMENAGIIQYTQILKLQDDTAPEIIFDDPDNCIENSDCQEMKRFEIGATDCNEAATNVLKYKWTISTGDTPLKNGEGSFFEYPVEPSTKYTVKWSVSDNCSNTSLAEKTYEFKDCKKPSPYCLHGLAVELMPDAGMIQIWAKDLDKGSFDNCSSKSKLKFRIWHSALGTEPVFLDEVKALPEVISLNCAYLGNQPVNFYVIDEADNWDYLLCKLCKCSG